MITESVSLCHNNNSSIDKRERLRKHSDDNIAPKHIKRSECMPLSKLESLISCPIHLGMMEDPRILPCGHVFCLNCLENCIASFGEDFRCPVCRQVAHVTDRNIKLLPPSIQTKQLTDCIVQAKAKFYEKKYGNSEYLSNESIAGAFSVSLENKRDLVKHLIKEIADYTKLNVPDAELYTDQFDKVLDCLESPQFLSNQTVVLENVIVHSSNNIDILNSNYELMDVETIRENMKKYCEYKLQRDVNNVLTSLYLPDKSNISATHIILTNDEPDVFVWSYCHSNTVMVKSGHHPIASFTIHIHKYVLRPNHIKIYNNHIYVSGIVENTRTRRNNYYLVQCTLSGQVLHRATFTDTDAQTEIAGFHIEQRTGKVLVALPTLCKIAVLSNMLTETSDGFPLTDLHPRFVTHNPECGEIWVTCPQDGRIAIIDEETGLYRQLGTSQIYNAIPSDITVTSDNRIIFLDCHANRVFWVRKRNDFILIQRINFVGHHCKHLHGRITSMHAVGSPGSNGKLLFTTANIICVVRPAKLVGEHHPKNLLCNIL